ncbi:MAG: CoA ester lyase [Acidobacteria bacterium]|nr:CoA ester lyase [Acidobacteriota bacterium]
MIGPIRSLLFAPGTRPDRFGKAMNAGADAVAFDLEDSVEVGRKGEARALVADYLAMPGTGARRLIRFNPPGTPDGDADLEYFGAATGVDGLLLPKIETAAAVEQVARAFAKRSPSGTVPPLFLLLETPRAILKAAEIVVADAPVAALLFGAEDYTASLAIERTIDGEELSFARAQIVLAAALVGADAIDGVCIDLNDSDALRRDCVRARALGFRGKMAIHPRQLDVINESFTPTAAEVHRARQIIDTYEAARAGGQGVTTLDGRMVELPIVERARRLVALAGKHDGR